MKHDPIFSRLANKDGSAAADCLTKYGGWVWSVAIAYSDSIQNAESLASAIFDSIWKNAERFSHSTLDDKTLITLIACTELRCRPGVIQNKMQAA